MECKNPFFDFISNCTTDIIVNAFLTPLTPYQWIISDKFGKDYAGSVTSDVDGNLVIPITDLPAGLLNSYGGQFTFRVAALYSCADVPLNMKQTYDSVIFEVRAGTLVKDNIGCD